jgi:hypothetical protein
MNTKNQDRQFQSAINVRDVRELIRQTAELTTHLGTLLRVIGDGRLPLDGSTAHDLVVQRSETPQYKPTIREERAKGRPELVPAGAPKPRKPMPARVVYELIVPDNGEKIAQDGLTHAARTIVRYLVVHSQPTIKELIDATNLQRSTIQNALTELRQRNLVRSVKIDVVG